MHPAFAATILASAVAATPVLAEPSVAVDILPVHSIVARIMQGVAEPSLIMQPGASPHAYTMRPSEARSLQDAGLVVWVGPDLTPWLEDPIENLAPAATRVTLQDAPDVRLLPIRVGGPFEPDEHAHGHEHADDHDHDHDHDHNHDTDRHDGHLWLNPDNAVAAARAVADALGKLDPENAEAYASNAEGFAIEMSTLSRQIEDRLEPVRGQGFLVFHDAYQYFEDRFDIAATGSVALQEGVPPGAARVAEIHDLVQDEQIVCAFTEPQFEPKLLETVIDGADLRTGVLDPIGATLRTGPGLYPELMRRLTDSLADCLAG